MLCHTGKWTNDNGAPYGYCYIGSTVHLSIHFKLLFDFYLDMLCPGTYNNLAQLSLSLMQYLFQDICMHELTGLLPHGMRHLRQWEYYETHLDWSKALSVCVLNILGYHETDPMCLRLCVYSISFLFSFITASREQYFTTADGHKYYPQSCSSHPLRQKWVL